MIKENLTVIFLLRNDRNALSNLENFLTSINKYDAGVNHEMVYIFKNFNNRELDRIQKDYEITEDQSIELSDSYYDIGSYYLATKHVKKGLVFFLNSYSRPQADNWLKFFVEAYSNNSSYLVGATGSYESLGFNMPYLKDFNPISVMKWGIKYFYRLLISIKNYSKFISYPNPHIRSNSFLTTSNIFLEYIEKVGIPITKKDCHQIESGLSSFTNFVKQRNLNPGIVDSLGKFYCLDSMHLSSVYRRSDQKHLIVKDNRTDNFENADKEEKISLCWDSWRQKN